MGMAWWGWDFGIENPQMSPFCFAGLVIRDTFRTHTSSVSFCARTC
jgi:hypothetical protein